MSREGANNRIDSLKNTLNTDHYQRSALGNAVRFNTMLSVLSDLNIEDENGNKTKFSRDDFTNALEKSVTELREDFDSQLQAERDIPGRRFDSEQTIQQKLQNRAYKTELGQTVAHATVQRKGMYQDFNTSYSTGATGAFRSFTNGFVQDDEDFFGSRVLYDNVFGQYEDGTESLSNRARLAMSDPTNDNRTVSEKVVDNIVNKSIYDQTEIIDRVDIEFGRFHGNSMIDAMSMTGSGLKAARQTIRNVMQEGSAYGRQVQARGSDDHPVTLAQALVDRTGTDLDTANSALKLLNNNLSNRSSTSVSSPDSGYVNKAGVAEFIDLINTAGTRDSNGALTGGRISISSFQFQNETISAALSDKIQRHVLESVLQGGGAPLQIDMTLAYPRQRNLNKQEDNDGRYAVGMTNYGILGPNLIEAMKLQEVENNIQDMLIGLGVPKEDIAKYVSLNIQFRDKKFHPKVYFTDNVASIGTQNLTAPVGNSVNQAGSNFETMRFVSNTFKNDTELQEARNNLGLSGPNHIQNNQITQSLLYRQIVNAAEQERTYNQNLEFNRTNGNTSTPILNQDSNSQVGFAGDIYQHISNTLAFAHSNSFESMDGFKPRNLGGSNTHMFMILDQAFMLQLGSTSFGKQLAGEMGAEVGITYEDKDNQTQQYKIQQNRLFDLLIADKANVVVDTKNYNEQVMKPLLDKINARDINTNELKNSKLVSNFEKHGQSLSMMAGFDLFKPSASQTKSEYDESLNIMFKELRRLGFSKEAGFDDSDLKQIIGMASGNIEMANVPRQHAKEAALFQYDNSGKAEIISYYQGSSNLGLYSLGVGSGKEGQYQAGDGNLTNTELGIMLGRRDINNNLSRSTQTNLNVSTEFFKSEGIINSSITEWALNNDEELLELMAAQRHFSVTWQQLARTNIGTIHTKKFDSTPSWQDNVNTKDLVVLRNRLEGMAKELGLSSDVLKVTERYADKSGSGITSINVSIDMNKVMSSSEFARPSSNLPRLNFELSVLQGPSRGEGMFHDSASEGDISGYVYFVDKNRVIGNGLFSNDSGQNITVLGRHNYEDKFENNLQEGRINLKSGQSAHMSSLDIVPQLFATLMGEAVSRFGTASSLKVFDDGPDNADNYNMSSVKELLLDYVAINLTGYSTQMDESISEGSNIVSSMKQIQNNLDVLSLQDLNETINRHARSIENRMDSSLYDSQDPLQQRKDKQALSDGLGDFNNKWFHHLRQNSQISENDVHSYINDLHNLVQMSPQLANMVVKTAYKDPNETANRNAFKDFQTLLFGSFLQTNDERTYGGQQGFYKTLLMGLGNSTADKNTASLMFDVDAGNPSLRNLGAYARFKPLEYNPLTDIHDVLYRSIASKSTSLLKNDDSLDSMFLESEARDLGDSANLRLISSIGVGNTLYRDDFIKKNESGLIEVGKDQKEIFDSMELAMRASGQSQHSIDLARKAYLDSVAKEFGDLDSEDRNDTVRLSFYTGNSKKLSQLPQRIKNAMGARPMYQFTVEAQMAIERGESLNELSEAYLNKYREPIVSASKNKVIALLNEREQLVSKYGETDERVIKLDNQIDDLKVIGSKAFNNKVSGLGAIFSGRVKSVLNQEQIDFIVKTKTRLYAAMGDLVEAGELGNDALDELVRVEILKAGLTNKGLGKMLAGNNHMNYSMALLQLAGTYNDTFLANPLYGTTYKSKEAYDNIQKSSINIYDSNLDYQDRDNLGVNNLGMKEGHYRTKQQSVKSSMIGAGGMEVLIQNDDIVVEDKATGNFVHKRKIDGEWKIVGQVDDSRNVQIIKNVVDRTGFSEVGSSGLGSSTASTYGRKGQNSVDYVYNVENRSGNFANNEYLLDISRITALDPSSGQRVEGTDSSALIKGVAVFAGRVKYSSLQNAQGKEQNVFENIEEQIMRSYSQGEIKGSLKSYLDYSDQTQKITLQDGREAYAPLSSSIHGFYNANNFKSFFWSHGATILRSEVVDSQGQKSSFMLDNLFNQDTDDAAIDSAKKIAGAFLVNFGTEFLQDSKDPAKQKEIDILKRSLVSEMVKGSYGSHYQKVVLEQTRGLGNRVNEIFENSELRKGRNKEDITSDLLFKEITKGQAGFNSLKTGALTSLSSSGLSDVLKGDLKASRDLINLVRTGMIDPVANRVKQIGGINFTNSADTQAALLVTAIDLMHQISGKGNQLKIPTDINFDSDKVKDVLLTLIGANKGIDDGTTEDIMEFLSGVSSSVPTISVFTDIIFSYSKDPTSTQSVARHEGQHLITPFMGDIQKYQEGGKLSNIQHTVASITAMVTGQASGMVFYDQMAKEGFKEKTSTNLISEDSDYLFSSFNKQQFLGFYQKGVSGVTTDNFVKEYKSINKDLLKGKYDWEPINVIRDDNDKTKISDTDQSYLDFDEDGKPGAINKAHAQVKRFVDKFHANDFELEKARVTDQLLGMGGDKFALHQLNVLTNAMSIENAKYQADTSKSTGRDTVSNLLENMTNKREYFSLPELSFEMQNGEIIARASNTKSLSTMLPSAQEMRVLGAEYSDFVDPVLNHYTNLSSIFIPGTIANTAFEKVRLAARENRAIVLSTEEYKAMAGVMDSARMMIPELQKASAGSRTQEAFGGKEKYQGFTSTGIGNLLVPFDSIALAQSKLDEAGMVENQERFQLMRQSDASIAAIENDRNFYGNNFDAPILSDDPWLDTQTGPTSKIKRTSPRLSDDPWLDTNTGPTSKIKITPPRLSDDPWLDTITGKTIGHKNQLNKFALPVHKSSVEVYEYQPPSAVKTNFKSIQRLIKSTTNLGELEQVVSRIELELENNSFTENKKNDFQSLLDNDIPNQFLRIERRKSFPIKSEVFGPKTPTRRPVLKRQDNNLDAVSKTKPVLRGQDNNLGAISKTKPEPKTLTGAFNQIQGLLHTVTNEEDLGKVSDLLESRIEDPNYSKLKQNKLQSLLDEDIPKIFENLQKKPVTTKNSFFTQPHMFGPEFNSFFTEPNMFGPEFNNTVKKIDSLESQPEIPSTERNIGEPSNNYLVGPVKFAKEKPKGPVKYYAASLNDTLDISKKIGLHTNPYFFQNLDGDLNIFEVEVNLQNNKAVESFHEVEDSNEWHVTVNKRNSEDETIYSWKVTSAGNNIKSSKLINIADIPKSSITSDDELLKSTFNTFYDDEENYYGTQAFDEWGLKDFVSFSGPSKESNFRSEVYEEITGRQLGLKNTVYLYTRTKTEDPKRLSAEDSQIWGASNITSTKGYGQHLWALELDLNIDDFNKYLYTTDVQDENNNYLKTWGIRPIGGDDGHEWWLNFHVKDIKSKVYLGEIEETDVVYSSPNQEFFKEAYALSSRLSIHEQDDASFIVDGYEPTDTRNKLGLVQVEAARKGLELIEMPISDADFLSSKFNQKGIQVNYKSDLQPGVAGEYRPKLGFVNIDDNMSASEKASTLLHELVHVYQEKNGIPLWGLQKHSSRANPEIHGSRALDSEVNLREWQAFSIEKHYKELSQQDPKQATEFLNTVINAFDSGDSDLIKNVLEGLGYKSELSDEYKQFTKHDIYSELEIEDVSLFSKKEGKRTIQLYSRTPTNQWGKQDGYVWASSNIESTKSFGSNLWILEVELDDNQGKYLRQDTTNKNTWGVEPQDKEWWVNFRGSNIVNKTYLGEIDNDTKVVTSPDEEFLHDAFDKALKNDWVDDLSIPKYWGRDNIQTQDAKMGIIQKSQYHNLEQNSRIYEKYAKVANKYKSRVLKDNTRDNENEWQYIIRSYLDLDGSEKSSYIGQLLEDRILGKELRSLPSEYEHLKDEVDTFQKKLNKESSSIEELFQTASDFSAKENKPFTIEEILKQTSDTVYYSKKDNSEIIPGSRNYMDYGRLDIGPYGFENLSTLQSMADTEEKGKLIGSLAGQTLVAIKEMEDSRDSYANEFAKRTGVSLNTAYEFLDKRIAKLKDLIDPRLTIPVEKSIKTTEPRIIDNPEIKTPTSELPKNSNKSQSILDSTSTFTSTFKANLNPLGQNIINFYRRQKAAEAFGVSKSLELDFRNMKKEAIAVKNKILDFAEIADLPEAERRAAFNTLYEEIKTKRDIAYRMSSLDENTGDSISNKNSEYAKNIPSEADRYIYHAQALNYDSLLAQLSIIGHQANLRPLTEQNVKEIETKAKQLSTIKFLLNSNEDAQGASTFIGLGHKESNLSEGALFTNKALSEGGGMVGQHMKNIQSLSSELRKLKMGAEAKQVKTQYAVQQIEATIQMYEKRMADMQAFSAERSVHSSKKDAQGNPLIDEKVQRNIDTASEQYNRNTLEVISYLKDKKAKLLSQPVNNDQVIRNTFEDIDVKIAEVDTANIYLAEVFRSPPPGGTDPRIHTYRVMQGVSALNQLSRSLSDNKEIGAENRMIYSTERGQTATMLASLGVVTLGGGDYDGDPYTVIFHQASKAQAAVDRYKGRITQNELLIKSFNNEITELQNKVRGLDPKNSNALKQRDQLEARITTLIEKRAEKQNRLIQDSSDLQEAKSNLELQITDGHKGLQARARKQVANYLGMDERLFVSSNEVMFDTNGKAILNEDGVEQKGLNSEKTYDADALVVLLEKGYNLMDGIQSSHKTIMGIMDSIDILTGYRSEPEAFQDGKFIEELTSRENLVSSPNGKISAESPAIGMLKARVAKFQANMEQLTPDQKQFVNSLKDAPVERYIAYLEQFKSMQTEMDKAISLHNLENQQKAEGLQKDFSRRAFMNQWIGGELYNAVVADKTLGKFMTQGVGMTLTEGTFDMTLKTLGKAGGEVLGKTYNTIIGTTFQDAPIISYGRQILDEESELHKATLSEFQKQAEGNSEKREKVIEELKVQGIEKNHPDFNKLVTEKTRALGYEEFDNYVKVTQKAVLKSEGTQGFMKNIHQLLRDSIKLKSDGDLLGTLQESSENYDKLSKQIAANDEGANDADVKQALIRERDAIIGGMSSKLGPGPGLKSLIDLDYLTNESSKTGLSRTDFESRFLTVGGIDSNRQMLNHYAESMTNLTKEESRHLTDPSTIGEESSALLKVARNMTAQNLANIVTSFRMEATAVEGRTDLIKGFARDHKAKLATQLGHHSITDTPRSVMQDGVIEQEDQTGKYIQEKYGIIESENSAGRFDTNRQHKNALGTHLGIEEAHIYNEDGTMSDAYRNKLENASKKLNISSEEYTLMFDIHHETSREQVKGVFGEDGKEMKQFTVMNMMRKNIARSMLDGRIPSAEASKTINESMGSEVLTTMAQLAAQNKLDSKGMQMFSGMYKGVVGHLLDATDGVVEYVDKSQRDAEGKVISERKTMKFSEMDAQQKGAYMTKLLHQTMLGTEVSQESGFTRSTSQEARDFKTINARVIANSDLEMDENGRLTNDFIDALDKAGANTLTGQQQEMYDAMSTEFVRSALDSDEQFDSVMRMALPTKGDSVPGRKSDAEYRTQMKRKVRAQMKIRQEQDAQKYASSRSRHGQSQSVMNRSSFMNKIDGSALDQLTTTAGSNVLDLFVPLALTAIGGAIQSGSIDNEELMQLGGATFTAFQYARTGTIESTQMDPTSYKKKLLGASAVGGIFKFKNALAQQGDENVGTAVAQIAVQEVTAASFNAIATPWLSKNIAEHGLGVKHAPAMNALDMKKYQAGQQLAGNIGASVISAISSTLISGLLMRGVESMSENVGQAIQSFLPAVQAVNSVNEAIAKKRQQENAYQDFEAETDNSEGQVSDYMVITDATYNPDNYASMSDLQEEQELEPSNDGSLSIGLLN